MTDRLRLSESNRRWWTLGAMCFALVMIMLDNTVVNVALPSIQRDFDASLSALEWTINAYTLTFAVLLVTGGRLGDIFGRRRVFLIGVAIFAARLRDHRLRPDRRLARRLARHPGRRRGADDARHALDHQPTRSRRTSAARRSGSGPACQRSRWRSGRCVGGWLTEDVSWRAIFFLNVPVAVGAIAVTLFAADESRDETVDRRSTARASPRSPPASAPLVLALVEGNSWGWGSPAILGLFALVVVSLAGFVVIERRSPAPIVDFAFFRSRQFVGANAVAFMVTFAMFGMFFFLALYLQNILGYRRSRPACASCRPRSWSWSPGRWPGA